MVLENATEILKKDEAKTQTQFKKNQWTLLNPILRFNGNFWSLK